jgi:hypothetical protein
MNQRTAWGLLAVALFGQTPPGGDFTFETPAGYQSRSHATSIEMVRIDQQRRFYCQLAVYASQPSQGSAAKDMETEWNAVVTNQFKVRGDAVTRDLPLPWAAGSLVRGASTTDRNGNPAISTLFVVRFPGNRYVGILYNAPNEAAFEACQNDAMQVVTSLRMKDGAAAPIPAPQPQQAPQPAAISGPPGNPASGSVVGVWERVVASQPAGRYNMFTKQWEYDAAAAMMQFKQTRRFLFDASGRYVFELDAEDYNRSERSRVVEHGRYSVQNGAIHFQPESIQEGKGPRGQNPPLALKGKPAPHVRRFLLGEHPQFQNSAGLQLQTGDGGWETYKPAR